MSTYFVTNEELGELMAKQYEQQAIFLKYLTNKQSQYVHIVMETQLPDFLFELLSIPKSNRVIDVDNHNKIFHDPRVYDAYASYYYPLENETIDEAAFNAAKLIVIHNCDYLPEHWSFIEKSLNGVNTIKIDMPDNKIVEYVCDLVASMDKYTVLSTLKNYKDASIVTENTANKFDFIRCALIESSFWNY